MGRISGNWITGTHSGRACRHENIYTKVNKKTGVIYSVKLCNPNTKSNSNQKLVQSGFTLVQSAISSWIDTEKKASSLSADFKKVKKAFDAQSKYATLRGYMIAKGMYSVSEDKQTVTVDITKRTDFKTAFGIQSGSVSDESGNSVQQPLTYTLNVSSADTSKGTVSPNGTSTQNANASVTVTATPLSGYEFERWNDNTGGATRSHLTNAITPLMAR